MYWNRYVLPYFQINLARVGFCCYYLIIYFSLQMNWMLDFKLLGICSVRALVTNPGHSFFLFMGYNSQQQSPSLFPQNHTGDMHSIFFFFLMHLFLLFYFYLWNCILFGLYYSSEKCISLKFDWEQSYKQNIFEIYYSIIGCEAKILNFCFSIDFS